MDFFEFPYDWRQDVRISALQLAKLIETLPVDRPVIIIGHSLGTMVSRYYIEHLGGSKRVERLRQIMLTFPTSYQILPDYVVGTDQHGKKINFLAEQSWLDPQYLPLLKLGCDFRNELGTTASIPTVSIFDMGLKPSPMSP